MSQNVEPKRAPFKPDAGMTATKISKIEPSESFTANAKINAWVSKERKPFEVTPNTDTAKPNTRIIDPKIPIKYDKQ